MLCRVKIWTDFAYVSPLMSHYLSVMIYKFCVYIKPLLSAHINVIFGCFVLISWVVLFDLSETFVTALRDGFCLLYSLILKGRNTVYFKLHGKS